MSAATTNVLLVEDNHPKEVFDGGLLARLIRHAIERHQIGVELERAQNEQLRLRDQFLTHVSHELRTPLAAMHQFLASWPTASPGGSPTSSSATSSAPCATPASSKRWSPSCWRLPVIVLTAGDATLAERTLAPGRTPSS